MLEFCMRLIAFLSDPIFSPPTLKALQQSRHELSYLITTPDVARGRGQKSCPSLPARIAQDNGVPILKPHSLRDDAIREKIENFGSDAGVVAAYPKLIPSPILALAKKGFWNVHPSLLPRWRGAAPVQRALLAGDATTGVSIIHMVEKMDAGEIILQETTTIAEDEDGESLMLRLAEMGAKLLIEALDEIECGSYILRVQDEKMVTLAPKVREEEARIDWRKPAATIFAQIRGVRPNFIAYTFWRGKRMQILKARPLLPAESADMVLLPGQLFADKKKLLVGCAVGMIELLVVRLEGRKAVSGAEFARGANLQVNDHLQDNWREER